MTVTHLHGGRPWRADLNGPLFDAARRALAAAFEREPVITGEGGSIPVVGDFQRILNAPVLLVGFGLPGENAHAPNEWMSEENFNKGMRAMAALWDELARALKNRHSRTTNPPYDRVVNVGCSRNVGSRRMIRGSMLALKCQPSIVRCSIENPGCAACS